MLSNSGFSFKESSWCFLCLELCFPAWALFFFLYWLASWVYWGSTCCWPCCSAASSITASSSISTYMLFSSITSSLMVVDCLCSSCWACGSIPLSTLSSSYITIYSYLFVEFTSSICISSFSSPAFSWALLWGDLCCLTSASEWWL